MRKEHLSYLCCPECLGSFNLIDSDVVDQHIMTGRLDCVDCTLSYPIIRGIPRFVPESTYADSFGLEWTIHGRTQHDTYTGVSASKDRFEKETEWPTQLSGKVVMEAGCGSGRFTVHAAATEATVLSFDLSIAVETNFKHTSALPNVLVVQASLYHLPFKPGTADYLYCFGVLQHTPNPKKSFAAISRQVKEGGRMVADNYPFLHSTWFNTKYWVRPLTRLLPENWLYDYCKFHIKVLWWLNKALRASLPDRLARRLSWRFLVPDYSLDDIPEAHLKEWAYLDIFDMLAPAYDKPVRLSTFRKWFEEFGFDEIDVKYGYNGCEGKGIRRKTDSMKQ